MRTVEQVFAVIGALAVGGTGVIIAYVAVELRRDRRRGERSLYSRRRP